ncbi:hypothetical protein KSP40_PGU013828 [Platanthera guangdongensis]|uniref:Uncharacterized protein n=1 Tax=Platanthera guangdongensis TaxID=2320717 RepID=A0ABR2LUG4_9ASPA
MGKFGVQAGHIAGEKTIIWIHCRRPLIALQRRQPQACPSISSQRFFYSPNSAGGIRPVNHLSSSRNVSSTGNQSFFNHVFTCSISMGILGPRNGAAAGGSESQRRVPAGGDAKMHPNRAPVREGGSGGEAEHGFAGGDAERAMLFDSGTVDAGVPAEATGYCGAQLGD